jgi:catechol 2,3-dioxygenase-like lactoylglutathione lyase family enzyme
VLGSADLVAFVATRRAEIARNFYRDVLGLSLVEDTAFALVFDANGTTLRLAKVETLTPAPYTVLGWSVENIDEAMRALKAKDVAFEAYPGMTDRSGIWIAPGGARIAWFRDPDGNLLSLTEAAGQT